MLSKNVMDMIPQIQKFFVGKPVKKAWLFGSCSRGEETSESDVDILVEYDRENARISLMTISGIMIGLEDILHRTIDIVEEGCLLPFASQTALKDKLLIYEKKVKDKGRLEHIKSVIEQLLIYKGQYTLEDVKHNPVIFYGFVKLVEIIGEAVYMLTVEYREAHNDVNWRQIEGMRHVLVHGYYTVDPATLWETIEYDIPDLKPVIDKLLAEYKDE